MNCRCRQGFEFVGDQAGTVIDLHQAAGDRDAALRKDHQRLAFLHHVDERADHDRPQRIERHCGGELEKRLDPPALRDAVVDGENRIAGQQRGGDWRIVESSLPAERVSSTKARFRVRVPARGEAVLTYRIRATW